MLMSKRVLKHILPTSIVGVGLLCLPARTQDASTLASPSEIIINPRFSTTFRSSNGNASSLGEFNGFIPILQTPGSNLLFLNLGIQIEGGDLRSGSLSIGRRRQLDNAILGGYLGYDIRDTGNNTFHQLGAGAELIGPGWALYLNGYLPVGRSQRTVANTLAITNTTFRGNQLFVDVQEDIEQSLGGIDIEGGLQLGDFGNAGTLWGYGGAYYLGDTVGARIRLNQTVADSLNIGLGLQSDGIFGTRGFFSLGYTFGAPARSVSVASTQSTATAKQDEDNPAPPEDLINNTLWLQAASPLQRNSTILVEPRTVSIPNQLAVNPATGQPWEIIHVTDGATGGNGTVESPLGEVVNALPLTQTSGNSIVYVDAGDRSGMTGFTIPANVQALSSGVTQTVPSQVTGGLGQTGSTTGQITGAGTGTLPLVQSTVTMGNSTTLSGFEVQPGNNTGVYARNVSDFIIDRNRITTASGRAINIEVQTGETVANATISGNTLATTGVQSNVIHLYSYDGGNIRNTTISGNNISAEQLFSRGLYVYASESSNISNTTISGNNISTTGFFVAPAIDITAYGNSNVSDTTISGNTISTAGDLAQGIDISSQYNSSVSNTTISGNTISTARFGSQGININAYYASTTNNTTITGNTVTTAGDSRSHGISIYSGYSTTSNTTISDNTILTTGTDARGIDIYGYGGTISNTTISGNTITTTNADADGIRAYTYYNFSNNAASRIDNTTITGNAISTIGTNADGIDAYIYDASTMNNVVITNNNIQQAGRHSVSVRTNDPTSNVCIARFSGNTSSGPNVAMAGGNDLNITITPGSTVNVTDFNNVSTNNTGFDNIAGTPTGQPPTCP